MAPRYDPETGTVVDDTDQPPPEEHDLFAEGLQALYQKYYHRYATPEEIQNHRGNPGGLPAIEEMFKKLFPPAKTDASPPPNTGGNTGTPTPPNGGLTDPRLYQPYGEPFTPPGPGDYPEFTPPPDFTFRDFVAPTGESVLNEPGYAFGLSQGQGALKNYMASTGLLRSGASAKKFDEFTQDYATQGYSTAYNRAAQQYQNDFNNALNAYGTNYGVKLGAFNANQGAQEQAWNQALSKFTTGRDTYWGDMDRIYNRLFGLADLGARHA